MTAPKCERCGRFTDDPIEVESPRPEVVQGDRIAVKGWLSWKKTERNGKTYVDVSINQPQLVAHEKTQGQAGGGWDGGEPF